MADEVVVVRGNLALTIDGIPREDGIHHDVVLPGAP